MSGERNIEVEDRCQGSEDFSEIKGQTFVKRAAEIAVAGEHNLLLIGPSGFRKNDGSKTDSNHLSSAFDGGMHRDFRKCIVLQDFWMKSGL